MKVLGLARLDRHQCGPNLLDLGHYRVPDCRPAVLYGLLVPVPCVDGVLGATATLDGQARNAPKVIENVPNSKLALKPSSIATSGQKAPRRSVPGVLTRRTPDST